MAQGIERFSAPPPGDDFDPTGEAQFRRLIEQFMENADYRVRDVGEDVESLDSRITTLENATDETGAWKHIETQDVSSVATVDFTGFLDSAYGNYVFLLSNVIPATDDVDLYLRTSTDAGSNWDSGASNYSYATMSGVSNTTRVNSAGASEIRLTGLAVGSDTGEHGVSGKVTVFAPAESDKTHIRAALHHQFTSGQSILTDGSGLRDAAEDVDGVRFLFSSGNVESGQISLYGIKDS